MKKILLPLMALALSTSSYAETFAEKFPEPQSLPSAFTNVTPDNFKFSENKDLNTGNISSKLFPTGSDVPHSKAQANLGAGYVKTNLDYVNSANGYFQLAGAYGSPGNAWSETAEKNFAGGLSILNLGEKIGNVLVINGTNSGFAEYLLGLKDELGLEDNLNIPACENAIGAITQLCMIAPQTFREEQLKPEETDYATLRVRITLSVFNKQNADAFTYIQSVKNDGATVLPATNTAVNSTEFRKYDNDYKSKTAKIGNVEDGSWNPYRWMVYEYELYPNNADDWYTYIRSQIPGNALNNAAILIRSVEFYYARTNMKNYEDGKYAIPDVAKKSWIDLYEYPEVETVTVYFDDTKTGYYANGSESKIHCYWDNCPTEWPGVEMTVHTGDVTAYAESVPTLFKVDIPATAQNIVFNDGHSDQQQAKKSKAIGSVEDGMLYVGIGAGSGDDDELRAGTEGTIDLVDNGFTVTYEDAVTLAEDADAIVIEKPAGVDIDGLTPTVSTDGDVLTVLLTGYPAGDYTVSITPGFVYVGSTYTNKAINQAVTVTADEEPGEDPTEPTVVDGTVTVISEEGVFGFIVKFEDDIEEAEDGGDITVGAPEGVSTDGLSPDVVVTTNTIVVQLSGYPAGEYTVTIPEGYVTVGETGINGKVVQTVTVTTSSSEGPGDDSGLNSVFDENDNAIVDIFDVAGQTIRRQVPQSEVRSLRPGVYILRQGNASRKVLVK